MGLWNDFLDLFGLGDTPNPTYRERPKSSPTIRRTPKPEPGALRSGIVEYIGAKFAKVQATDVKAVIFLGEMSDRFISNPSEVLKEGQAVDFVLIRSSEKKPGEWVGSINAVPEARVRAALSVLSVGNRVVCHITDLKDDGAVANAGTFEVWIPIVELAWCLIGHPAESVALSQEVSVEIIRIELPDGWLVDKRKRQACAIGSIRACEPHPVSPVVQMAFSSQPFKIWAVAKIPRTCDPIVLYVLEEISTGKSSEEMHTTTGLPRLAIDKIHELLTTEGLAKHWCATTKGKKLIEAIIRVRELNADPAKGFFISAAHPMKQFANAASRDTKTEYPSSWPWPASNRRAENEFWRAANETIPEALISRIVTEDKRKLLATLQEDNRLLVFLRRDSTLKGKPIIYVETPVYWIFAGLWSSFDPVGEKPFRPSDINIRCRNLLMIQANVLARKNGQPIGTLFFEPYTKTFWRLKAPARVVLRKLKGLKFPDLPKIDLNLLEFPAGETAKYLLSDSWCSVEVN
jgi:small subunit ribosomal protein S1